MDKKIFDIQKRSYVFALDTIKFLEKLPRDYVSQNLAKRLLGASSNVGAHVREAQHAGSAEDFVGLYTTALKSTNESDYWLSLLRDTRKASREEVNYLLTESWQISKILATSISKAKKKNEKTEDSA